MVKIGDVVAFTDTHGVIHKALVTAVHGPTDFPDNPPSVNTVHVSSDGNRTDGFGRQTEHHGSVVHKRSQPAHGYYYELIPQ